jgi:hypothetical protein
VENEKISNKKRKKYRTVLCVLEEKKTKKNGTQEHEKYVLMEFHYIICGCLASEDYFRDFFLFSSQQIVAVERWIVGA